MTGKLRRALSLPAADRWTLLHAWIWLLLTDVGLRLRPLSRVQQTLAARAASRRRAAAGSPERLARLVDIAGRHHLYPMRCLPRAVTLQYLLSCHGLETDLRIGVRRSGDELEAHAWLEHGGRAIGEPPGVEQRFTPLLPPPAER